MIALEHSGTGTGMSIKLEKVFIAMGIAKLKSDPGLGDLTDKALKGFLAEKSSAETSTPDGKKLHNKFANM